MLARRTQTNEPARCATLLPALAQLPPPLALIEVGASAGLTLLFDRYSYDFARHQITGSDPLPRSCAASRSARCPCRPGSPRSAGGPGWTSTRWMSAATMTSAGFPAWSGPVEGDREQRLAAAIAAARRDPPAVHRTDLRTDLPALAARAPVGATLVIYHSAVLAYLTPADRRRVARTVRSLPAVWLSNEGPGVVPDQPIPPYQGTPFALARDGGTPLALTDSHGMWLNWLSGPGRNLPELHPTTSP